MSLLTICQSVANDTPVDKPSVIVGSTNETARLLLSCAQKAGESLYRSYNWLALQTEHTFSTVAAQADYSLPSDYGRLINQSLWDRDNYEELRGPLSPQEWQAYKSSVLANTSTIWSRFRIRNVSGTVKFSLHPTPTSVRDLVFEYVSKHWCESSGGTGQNAWQADSDVGVLDEYLIELGARWRFLSRLGLPYAEERKEYDDELRTAMARDGGAPVLSLNRNTSARLIGPWDVPDTGYGA